MVKASVRVILRSLVAGGFQMMVALMRVRRVVYCSGVVRWYVWWATVFFGVAEVISGDLTLKIAAGWGRCLVGGVYPLCITLIGYARVSTKDQYESLHAQERVLYNVGCEKIYTEVASRVKTARPKLLAALRASREGNTLIVTRLDRLGRSTLETLKTVAEMMPKECASKH
ncbi:recombinase family protein [uncultured Rothia sp.]|uniref:recombinase family protein n=1 Tax=uncultured Rothia sp. TaxID=316088 RepID=UPI003217B565